MTLLRSALAPEPRTLVDIFYETVLEHPNAYALDNGSHTLTYEEFAQRAEAVADELAAHQIGRGNRVAVRINSGTVDLYIAIMGILVAGAAYVPIDADDPDERARTIIEEAEVSAVITNDLVVTVFPRHRPFDLFDEERLGHPELTDDAWIIFTSGSTGKPKGVAVTHRSAAGFVDAESELFLQDHPISHRDRVMAGLSVAFDASCEEIWLAWRYGACLVPAPRSLVRSGMDLGPWLVANNISIVSTVPTLVSLWPAEALDHVRLLILGGEACPPEIGARFANPDREVWNTYGPTEATVVACAAQLTGEPPVRIGLPLSGWDLAIVDEAGNPVAEGETGELIIGGIGLARYLDPIKDAEKYAPLPALGWDRAYRSGDLVVNDPEGLIFLKRADDQVKVGGRRIELGEIDAQLLDLPGVVAAATAVRSTETGNKLLVGYLTVDATFVLAEALATLRRDMPAALVPRLAIVDDLPTKTSGKIDRDALPWPLPEAASDDAASAFEGTAARVRELWQQILGAKASTPEDDFFDLGGGSLTAAQLVSLLRVDHPEVVVADVYEHSTVASLAAYLDAMKTPTTARNRTVGPVPFKTQVGQVIATGLLRTVAGIKWLAWIALGNALAHLAGLTWLPTLPWWAVLVLWALFISAPGRMLVAAAGTRVILWGVQPGSYPRGGKVHLRLWAADHFADAIGAASNAGAYLMRWYARLLGAHVEPNVDLHTVPPITGMLHLGAGCAIESEVDLAGYWLDGAWIKIGTVTIGSGARIGARSTLTPGASVGMEAEVAPGSAVFGEVPAGEFWSGAPARYVGTARGPWEGERAAHRPVWQWAYALLSFGIALIPLVAMVAGFGVLWPSLSGATSLAAAVLAALPWLPLAVIVGYGVLMLEIWATVRLLSRSISSGHHPVHSLPAWSAWATMRIMDEARTWLFALYSSTWTPAWLRLLGADIGKDVESSTAMMIPKLTTIGNGAFLADDTMIGGYELGGGWLRVEKVRVGKRAFVGNSGMAAPGRKVPKESLVAVLSAAPRRGKAKGGTSWIGSPPTKLRRSHGDVDQGLTYDPPTRLRVFRALIEACRFIPTLLAMALAVVTVAALEALVLCCGWPLAFALSGVVLLASGTLAALVSALAKWLLIGRLKRSDHPLWSSLVWRNELADTFIEVLAAPWFARPTLGTPLLNVWLRGLGAEIGRGVWCDTYWLPEPDLIRLGDGVNINAGCVVQTHLFHDRVLSIDAVTLRSGATLGPNSVILPAATLGRSSTVGPVSLVMRGESVPDKTRWIGNPIGPWAAE